MIDPRLWSSTPFRNKNALLDLNGQLELFHRALADQIARNLHKTYYVYALGTPGATVENWMNSLQTQCSSAAQALGIPQPPDLESYDLSDEGDFASWTFQVGQFHRGLQLAAGLP